MTGMKQLVILSGKGGTGKTSLAAAFAHLAHNGRSHIQAVLADADVDAANLELVLHSERIETHDFTGGSVAVIDQERCQGCGICEQVCRFDAVQSTPDGYALTPLPAMVVRRAYTNVRKMPFTWTPKLQDNGISPGVFMDLSFMPISIRLRKILASW